MSSLDDLKDTDDKDDKQYADILVGCALAVGGNLLISISLNLQKYTHNRAVLTNSTKHYLHQPLWWLGLLLMGLGEIGNFSAYGFAPASLVAPLGTTTVIANMFIAAIFLKEKIRLFDVFGSVLAILGAFLIVYFSSKKELILSGPEIVSYLTEQTFVIYCAIELAALLFLFVLKYKYDIESVIVLIMICALMASFTVISAKAVSGMLQLTMAGHNQFSYAILYILVIVMLVTAIAQVKFLNQAMQSFDSTVVVPTNFVFFTISAILAGVIFYKEFWGMAALNIAMFILGCVLCFVAVYFVTFGRHQVSTDPDPQTSMKKTHLDIFPTWLLSCVTELRIQPNAKTGNKQDSDKTPMISNKLETISEISINMDDMHPRDSLDHSYGTTKHR